MVSFNNMPDIVFLIIIGALGIGLFALFLRQRDSSQKSKGGELLMIQNQLQELRSTVLLL